jgi:hypothetical protein
VWLPGSEGANAIGNILVGKANPSGKLTQTFPLTYSDSPSIAMATEAHAGRTWATNPVYYDEGVYVGYRYFDTFSKEDRVAYPFGYGLSYTTFELSNLSVDKAVFSGAADGETVTVSVDVKNTGAVAGKEVVQIYLSASTWQEEGRPKHDLRAFAKSKLLAPGEAQTLTFELGLRDLQWFDDGNPDNDLTNVTYNKDDGTGVGWTVADGTEFTVLARVTAGDGAEPNKPISGPEAEFTYDEDGSGGGKPEAKKMTIGVYASKDAAQHPIESSDPPVAEAFQVKGEGLVGVGAVNVRLSYKEGETLTATLGAALAGKATLRGPEEVTPVAAGYKTVSFYVLANEGGANPFTLADGDTLIDVTLAPSARVTETLSLLLGHADVAYYDAAYQGGKAGLDADVTISPAVASTLSEYVSKYDVNGDGKVTLADVNAVRQYLGVAASASAAADAADIDDSGAVDLVDLTLIIAAYEAAVSALG